MAKKKIISHVTLLEGGVQDSGAVLLNHCAHSGTQAASVLLFCSLGHGSVNFFCKETECRPFGLSKVCGIWCSYSTQLSWWKSNYRLCDDWAWMSSNKIFKNTGRGRDLAYRLQFAKPCTRALLLFGWLKLGHCHVWVALARRGKQVWDWHTLFITSRHGSDRYHFGLHSVSKDLFTTSNYKEG